MKTDPSRKKYDVRKKKFFLVSIIIANCLSLQFPFFFISANIITVGQRRITTKELEIGQQNQAITLALSASSNTNMVADIIPVSAEGGA